jgi:hypothetical protein
LYEQRESTGWNVFKQSSIGTPQYSRELLVTMQTLVTTVPLAHKREIQNGSHSRNGGLNLQFTTVILLYAYPTASVLVLP